MPRRLLDAGASTTAKSLDSSTRDCRRWIEFSIATVPAKNAQEQLGHASISTTLGIYTHVVDASHRATVTALEERLFGVMLRNREHRSKRDARK